MSSIRLKALHDYLEGKIFLPASKSISNRLLIINALNNNDLPIQNLSEAEDTRLLQKLISYENKELNTENSGTTMRFLTAYLSITEGEWILTGSERMKIRPIGDLVNSLASIGADISYIENHGFPPLKIRGKDLPGGRIKIDSTISSQFISALLLIAPKMKSGLELELVGKPVSYDYIQMTLKILSFFNIIYQRVENKIIILPQEYDLKELFVESDWSSASYIYGIASLFNSVSVELSGLKKESWQGDAIIAELMKRFGVVTDFRYNSVIISNNNSICNRFEFDFTNYPDLILTFAVLCACHQVPFYFKGTKALRIKESDRIETLFKELKKVGLYMEVKDDELVGNKFNKVEREIKLINTHGDHRIAMSFSLASIKYPNLIIENPSVVAKSYPNYWSDLENLGIEAIND